MAPYYQWRRVATNHELQQSAQREMLPNASCEGAAGEQLFVNWPNAAPDLIACPQLGQCPVRSLVLKQQWLDKIYSGRKTWELRSRYTNIRGRIGLIASGTGVISGEARIVKCFLLGERGSKSGCWKIKEGTFKDTKRKHGCEERDISRYCSQKVYAWVLAGIKQYDDPISYVHPRGAVTWVRTG